MEKRRDDGKALFIFEGAAHVDLFVFDSAGYANRIRGFLAGNPDPRAMEIQ
jgi:hypothetical protein